MKESRVIEHALIVGIVALAVIGVVTLFGDGLRSLLESPGPAQTAHQPAHASAPEPAPSSGSSSASAGP
jgi:Flp pilus assembly pilin Flp